MMNRRWHAQLGQPILLPLCCIVLLSSCSWVSSSRRSLIGNDPGSTAEKADLADPSANPPANTVSRGEYEDLLRRYEDLSHKYAQSKENEATFKVEKDKNAIDPRDAASQKAQLVETVDIFEGQAPAKTAEATSVVEAVAMAEAIDNPGATEAEILKIRQAKGLMESKSYDKALELLQPMEQTTNRQIRVRVKTMIAKLLMTQNEYDLAMQVFEEVIQKYAFSGHTLEALQGLVTCTEKLNMTKKREQYYSILNDVFGKS